MTATLQSDNICAGAYEKNEACEVEFLRSDVPEIPHSLSPLSSDCLYRRTQTSIPCDISLKSRLSILLSRYSKSSGGNVTVTYGLFLTMQDITLHEEINSCNVGINNARQYLAGTSKHEQNGPTSECYGNETRTVCPQPDSGRDGYAGEQDPYTGQNNDRVVAGPAGERTQGHGTSVSGGIGRHQVHPFILSGGA